MNELTNELIKKPKHKWIIKLLKITTTKQNKK